MVQELVEWLQFVQRFESVKSEHNPEQRFHTTVGIHPQLNSKKKMPLADIRIVFGQSATIIRKRIQIIMYF